jgi:hypothetical protein
VAAAIAGRSRLGSILAECYQTTGDRRGGEIGFAAPPCIRVPSCWPPQERLIFPVKKAWNEWAEGNYVEPMRNSATITLMRRVAPSSLEVEWGIDAAG